MFSSRLAGLLFKSPKTTVVLLLAVIGISFVGLRRITTGGSLELFMAEGSPLKEVCDRVEEEFVSEEVAFVVYEADDVFSASSLRAVRELGEKLEAIQVAGTDGEDFFPVEDVTSLVTVKDYVSIELGFQTVSLVPDPIPAGPEALEKIRQRAHKNSIVKGRLLSDDDKAAGVVVRLVPELGGPMLLDTLAAVRAAMREVENDHPGIKMHVTGIPTGVGDTFGMAKKYVGPLALAHILVALLLLFIFVRKPIGWLVACAGLLISVVAAWGLVGLTGGTFQPMMLLIDPISVVVSVVMLVHLYSELGKARLEGAGSAEGHRQRVFAGLLRPIFLMAATTSVGLFVYSQSSVPAVQQLGWAAGPGVMAIFLVVMLATALAWGRIGSARLVSDRSVATSQHLARFLSWLSDWLPGHRMVVLVSSLGILVLIVLGILRIEVGALHEKTFDEDTPFVAGKRVAEEHLGGMDRVVIRIAAEEDDHFQGPAALKKVEALDAFLRSELGASDVVSLLDFVKLANKTFHRDDEAFFKIPETREQVAQLLLLNGDTTIEEYVDHHHTKLRILARLNAESRTIAKGQFDAIEHYLSEHFARTEGYVSDATGILRLLVATDENLVDENIRSIVIAFIVIFLLIGVFFRSIRALLLCIIPNTLPVAFAFGFMGWAGIPLSRGTAISAATILGLAVDDTIHFLTAYIDRSRSGDDPLRAVKSTLALKGPAIVWSSLVIAAAFAVNLFVPGWRPEREFGLLLIVAMGAAVLADLFILPAIILTLKPRFGKARLAGKSS